MRKLQNRHIRSSLGQGQLAELGPVLFVFFLLFFFPMINLMSLGASFASGWLLNYSEAREAALIFRQKGNNISSPSPGDPTQQIVDKTKLANVVRDRVTRLWVLGPFGHIARPDGGVGGIVTTYTEVPVTINGRVVPDRILRVTTRFQAKPFMTIPFPTQVPGLNVPFQLQFSTENTTE